MSSVQQIPIPGQASHHSSSSNLRTRVCHVSMCLTTGGLERLLVEFARRTSRQQFELTFVALGEIGQPAREIEKLGLEVVSLAEKASGRFGRIKALRRLFVDRNIDVIHSHNTYAHFHAALAGQAAGVHGILNTQHGRGCGNHWKQRTDFFIANRFTDRILSVSEDSARICRRQDWFSKSKIETLWNGIDVDRFRYHGPVTEPRAITVSRLSPEKDLPTLLRAVKLVIAQHPDFHLTVVGDGSERSLLENLSRELQLTS
ncbi:MAG: glycosyltransferase, partial [Planctomycetaceae bacterium]|nr:glycosyltransferase [Planctomycetaceae bacterium]